MLLLCCQDSKTYQSNKLKLDNCNTDLNNLTEQDTLKTTQIQGLAIGLGIAILLCIIMSIMYFLKGSGGGQYQQYPSYPQMPRYR